jgi:hypothetical protein
VLVVDRPDPVRLLEGLRRGGVTHLDVVVVRGSSRSTADAVEHARRRIGMGLVLAPAASRLPWARPVERPVTLAIGGLTVEVRPGGSLDVAVRPVTVVA